MSDQVRLNPVRRALECCRPHFVAAIAFSAVVNVLLLTPSIFMMQVYDRVVPTAGLVTLAALCLVATFAYATLSLLDWLRGRLLVRAGIQLDRALAGETLKLVLSRPSLGRVQRMQAMRDVDTLRGGISSPAASALFDAPWTPIYILAAFLLHPALGLLALLSSLLILALAWHSERRLRAPTRASSEAGSAVYARQLHISSHAAEVRALGMSTALTERQLLERSEVNALQAQASFSTANHGGLIRFLRLALQSGALALGAILVVEGKVSAGAIFASSLLLSRALQPIEQLVAAWKTILQSRTAYANLSGLFGEHSEAPRTALPAPTGVLQVERLVVVSPVTERVALAEASFAVAAGEIIGLVGPSGAGKTTLLSAISGAAPIARGHVRFDGAANSEWDAETLARHIGFLPQNFIMFPGTVKENISRFRGVLGEDAATIDAAAIEAARKIDAHDMIVRLPEGYDTPIGSGGLGLSAGQAQKIAIARALFGSPRLLLLDEPTAHLDAPAQHAFIKLLSRLRQEGATVLFASHSGDILASADKLLLLKEGRVEGFGPLPDGARIERPVSHVPQRTRQ